jgi:ribosomal protein L37AE/L43A
MTWSSMGVFDKAKTVSHLGAEERGPYICLECEESFEVLYHSCPVCDAYDVRRAKWVE